MHITIRMLLGLLFVYAAWGKIAQPADFARAVANYQILPEMMVNPVALLLPWIELISGICLLIGQLVRGSALIIGLLLTAFIGALTFALVRGLDIHCGCFNLNAGGATNMYLDILMDVLLLAMAVWVLWRPCTPKTIHIDAYSK